MTSTIDQDAKLAQAVARTGQKYDAVPYTSIPFQRLQPSRLAANAYLLGLDAPDVRRARTLEIGCASGGHLMPLAAAFPEAQFVGVDISAAQIADGSARAGRLGLNNVSLRAGSLAEIDAHWGQFDYIICHGVYSWVPDAIRDAIMRVSGERLSSHGIAAISFNVLPGWRVFQAVRDSLILHAGDEKDDAVRTAKAREMFDLMAQFSPEKSSYGSVWRNEARRMVEQPDSYIAHEIFEDDNAPCTFRSFAAAAGMHGLAYLGETRVRENVPESGDEQRAALVRQLSGGELLATEQYIDVVTGRTFRESLLIRADRAADVKRALDGQRLAGLHLIPPLDLRITSPEGAAELVIEDGDGASASTQNPAVCAALRVLIDRAPQSTALDQLVAGDHPSGSRDQIAAVIMHLILQGSLDVSTSPIACARDGGPRPKAWPLIASDAAAGCERSATLRHAPFLITPLLRFLLPLLDGVRSREDIVATLVRLAESGEVSLADEKGPISDPERLRTACAARINRELAGLARIGALVES